MSLCDTTYIRSCPLNADVVVFLDNVGDHDVLTVSGLTYNTLRPSLSLLLPPRFSCFAKCTDLDLVPSPDYNIYKMKSKLISSQFASFV